MDLRERVEKCLGPEGLLIATTECQGDLSVEVPKTRILDVMHLLRDTPDLEFDFLSDVFGVDNSAFYEKQKPKKKSEGEDAEAKKEETLSPPRFEVVYLLLSLGRTERLEVKVRIAEDDLEVDSVTSIWKSANWPEREAFDMFGIRFKGHPNLKRLLMWDEFPAYPLRKDYPLEGRGEERHLAYNE